MYESKILYGLDKIHYCAKDGVIKPLSGAFDIEISLEQAYTYSTKEGHDAIRINGSTKGKGKLTLLSLTLEEQADLFGYSYKNGELGVGGNYNPPTLSLLCARQKADGGEIYTVVYKCVFNNPSINGTTLKGELEEGVMTLDFDVLVDLNKELTYFSLDTKVGDKNKVDNFFKEIQIPSV